MPRSITTANQAREIYDRTSICYLCGREFTLTDKATRDHVPPRAIFLKEDRDFPLQLPAHKKCNRNFSIADEQIGQLVALLHGRTLPPIKIKIQGHIELGPGKIGIAVTNLALGPMITKIVRGCHMALYGEYLPSATRNKILPPIPEIDEKTMKIAKSVNLPQHQAICTKIKDTARLSSVDRIRAFNNKFEFICCWGYADDGITCFNLFGMRIYDWEKLGDKVLGRPQGCIGSYESPSRSIPRDASVATLISGPYRYQQPLNPFEEFG